MLSSRGKEQNVEIGRKTKEKGEIEGIRGRERKEKEEKNREEKQRNRETGGNDEISEMSVISDPGFGFCFFFLFPFLLLV
eukprot:1195099-Amorphochlora_amoeboformis.AAC.1